MVHFRRVNNAISVIHTDSANRMSFGRRYLSGHFSAIDYRRQHYYQLHLSTLDTKLLPRAICLLRYVTPTSRDYLWLMELRSIEPAQWENAI